MIRDRNDEPLSQEDEERELENSILRQLAFEERMQEIEEAEAEAYCKKLDEQTAESQRMHKKKEDIKQKLKEKNKNSSLKSMFQKLRNDLRAQEAKREKAKREKAEMQNRGTALSINKFYGEPPLPVFHGPKPIPFSWESISRYENRAKVQGGWLVEKNNSWAVFVPDAKHDWRIN